VEHRKEKPMINVIVRIALVAGVVSAMGLASVPAYAADVPTSALPTVATGSSVPHVTIHGCPTGFFCFYQNAGFGGRRVQFQSCGLQNMTNFGFNDEASSWVNNTSSSVDVYRDTGGLGGRLWHEDPGAQVSYVGDANNDQASSFRRNC
jgi:hypothetical protein